MGDLTQLTSSLLHLGGAIVVLLATPHMLGRVKAERQRYVACAVYAFALCFLLVMSSLYHLTVFLFDHDTPTSEAFRRLDHIGVWLVIAGFMTPPLVFGFRGLKRRALLSLVWVGASVGVLMKILFFGAFPLSTNIVIYSCFNGISLAATLLLVHAYGAQACRLLLECWAWLLVATVFFVAKPPDVIPGVFGFHEFWHVGIMLGAWAHWRWVLRYADVDLVAALEVGAAESASECALELEPLGS